jgi:hypothetical protein
VLADVSPSTTSVHLDRLRAAKLVTMQAQRKHRLYSLAGPDVARAPEGLSVLAGSSRDTSVSNVPSRLRVARTCYDHMARIVGSLLHDRLKVLGWLSAGSRGRDHAYDLTIDGTKALQNLDIEVEETRELRRRFACACPDWSEQRPHPGGARRCPVENRPQEKMGTSGPGQYEFNKLEKNHNTMV